MLHRVRDAWSAENVRISSLGAGNAIGTTNKWACYES